MPCSSVLLYVSPLRHPDWKVDVFKRVSKIGLEVSNEGLSLSWWKQVRRPGAVVSPACSTITTLSQHPLILLPVDSLPSPPPVQEAASVNAQACKDEVELNSPPSIINPPWLHSLIQFWCDSPTAHNCGSVCLLRLAKQKPRVFKASLKDSRVQDFYNPVWWSDRTLKWDNSKSQEKST